MGTMFRIGSLRVAMHSNDHRPPHVHVIGTDGTAKIALGELCGSCTVLENDGLSSKDLAAVVLVIEEKQAFLLQRWREIHGDA
jgi:hypothetical protein